MTEPVEPTTLARAEGVRGEVLLRRRRSWADGRPVDVEELIVNGAFAMDSAETATEQALGALAGSRRPGARVLVGGLGLGFTVLEVCRYDVASVDVVEIEECLVEWARAGVSSSLSAVAADPRVRLVVGDVADVLADPPFDRTWDVIVLDVDNGPDFLIHPENARLYTADLLGVAAGRLAPGGMLAIWCQGPAPDLDATLRALPGQVDAQVLEVLRDGRWLEYAIYTHTRQ